MKRKKILYLITKSNWGGAQRYVFDLATHLDTKKFDVVVALGGDGPLVHKLTASGVRVIQLETLGRDISVLKEIKSAIAIIRMLIEEKPDILHINSSKAGGLGAFLGRLTGVPHVIFTAHAWAFNENRPWWQKIIIHILHWITVILSHTTITVSDEMRRQMKLPFVHNKMQTIHNGVQNIAFKKRAEVRELLSASIPKLKRMKNDFWSVTIGELHSVKQHDVVIRALKVVTQTNPSIRHIIIGEGEERTRLESLIAKLDLTSNVFLVGAIPNAAELLKGFELFILGSRSEALGYVLLEASAAGLPIIASNVGGIPEIITHEENGLLVPSGDTEKIAEYYINLYTNEGLRTKIGAAAYTRFNDFSFEKALAKTLVLYKTD